MTTVTCNVCIDESDLDTILANLATLRTNLADWIEAKEVAEEINDPEMYGLSIQSSVGITLSNINIDETENVLITTQEQLNQAIAILRDFVSHR